MILLIIVIVGIIAVGYGVIIFNRLDKGMVLVQESWSIVDDLLTERANLADNFIEVSKGYIVYKKIIVEGIVNARNQLLPAESVVEKAQAEKILNEALKVFFIEAQSNLDLSANEVFINLKQKLSENAAAIEKYSQNYNEAAEKYNVVIESIAGTIIARLFGFEKAYIFTRN